MYVTSPPSFLGYFSFFFSIPGKQSWRAVPGISSMHFEVCMEESDCMEGILDLQCKGAANHIPSGQFNLSSFSVKPHLKGTQKCVFENDQPEWLFSKFSTKKTQTTGASDISAQTVCTVCIFWLGSRPSRWDLSCTHPPCHHWLSGLQLHPAGSWPAFHSPVSPSPSLLSNLHPHLWYRCRTLSVALLRFAWAPSYFIYLLYETILGKAALFLQQVALLSKEAVYKSRWGMLMMYLQADSFCLPGQ